MLLQVRNARVIAAMLIPLFIHSSESGDGAFSWPLLERPQLVDRAGSRPWTTRRMYPLKLMQLAAEWAKKTISTGKSDFVRIGHTRHKPRPQRCLLTGEDGRC